MLAPLDPNELERRARQFIESNRPRDAMAIYLFMADGDPSLDAGYLAHRIGECLETMGDLHSAKWWYGRAVEENPERAEFVVARNRLEVVSITALLNDC